MKKITLFCNAGMSTSMLVKKMIAAAEKQGLEVSINAYPINSLASESEGSDIVLLGPQVSYEQKRVAKHLEPLNIPLGVIPMVDYGMMNGEKVLAYALSLEKERD